MCRGRKSRHAFPDRERSRDLYLLCVSEALSDHEWTPEELQALRYLRTLLGIEDGELFETRRPDLRRIVADVMYLVLADDTVDREESRLKDAVRETLDLGPDEFLSLGEAPLHDALRRILGKMDASARGFPDADFVRYESKVRRLDSVFPPPGRAPASADRHVPIHVRDAVWRRDQGRCTPCGSQEAPEFDHIIPFTRGGSNTYRNVQLLCEPCNRTKSAKIG